MSLNFVKKTFKKVRKNKLLNDRMQIRINNKEKILFEKYAKVCGVEIDELIKGLVRKEIDKFIKG